MGKLRVGFIGIGNRGAMYAQYAHENKDRVSMDVLVDFKLEEKKYLRDMYNFKHEFTNSDEFFKQKIDLDLICISSMDKYHFDQAVKSINLGYNILLEKPIGQDINQIIELEKLAKSKNVLIVVCHVLRYTVFYKSLKDLIDKKEIGDVVNIVAREDVAFWHQAHSYVRGNWKYTNECGPQILTKCSHDLDILNWLMADQVTNVSSFGAQNHFKKHQKPAGASDRCATCNSKDTCHFNANKFYQKSPDWLIPFAGPNLTPEKIDEFLTTSDYGRCVYDMESDNVDHQIVNMRFSNNATASLTMNAFSKICNRHIQVFATKADVTGDFEKKQIEIHYFDGREEVIDIAKLTTDFEGHGGGDRIMFNELLDFIIDGKKSKSLTLLTDSIVSHKLAFLSEESRLNDGKSIIIK